MSIADAGRWLLHSGIQNPSGGVARYYDTELRKYKPVSTEITGYAASALVYLFRITNDQEYLDRAQLTARFLTKIWDWEASLFPFEYPSHSAESDHLAYFFDSGIIVRGLLAVWRETADEELLDIAGAAAHGMIDAFRSGGAYHPILKLPEKIPLPRSAKWSRAPGCYQLKSAMGWWDLAGVTGENALREAYLELAESVLATHRCFLPAAENSYDEMDRLHAYLYFLEGLLPLIERPDCAEVFRRALDSATESMRAIEPVFVRSDVCAQLLRARYFVNQTAPAEGDMLGSFQARSDDPRIDGGFWFGRRDGRVSQQINPVSTIFAVQAMRTETEQKPPCLRMLI